MKTYCVGETIVIPEYNGIISKTISQIFWRMNGKGNNSVEKLAVLAPALEDEENEKVEDEKTMKRISN
jgi:hypothetical protein